MYGCISIFREYMQIYLYFVNIAWESREKNAIDEF